MEMTLGALILALQNDVSWIKDLMFGGFDSALAE